MSRHSLSLSPEQLTAFDLDAFVAHAEALNLYQHTVLPLPPLTQFEVGGIAFRGMEGGITQNNHALFNLPNQPLKGIVGDIGRGTCPPHDQSPLIEQETQFAADNPAMVRHAFAADLLGTAAFAHGVNQLDAIRVNAPKDRRGGEEAPCPVVMGPQEAKEAGALGEAGKQRPIVTRQPAIEGTVAHALEGMQQPQRDDLTGPEVGLRVLGEACQMIIDLAE